MGDGNVTLTFKLVTELDADCKKAAAAAGIFLPEEFSMAPIFRDITDKGRLNTPLLDAAVTLRKNGKCWLLIRRGILTLLCKELGTRPIHVTNSPEDHLLTVLDS